MQPHRVAEAAIGSGGLAAVAARAAPDEVALAIGAALPARGVVVEVEA